MLGALFKLGEKLILRFMRQRRAAIAPMVALTLPVVIGMLSVGVDFSAWMMDRRDLQTAADAAAISAAYESYFGDAESMNATALREAVNNGYEAGADSSIDVVYTAGNGAGLGATVQVTLTMPTYHWFSQIYGDDPKVQVTAVASIDQFDTEDCLLGLDDSAKGTISTNGNVTINAPNCGVTSNSSDDQAFLVTGDSSITVGDVTLAGDYDIIGNSVDFDSGRVTRNAQDIEDPYADLEVPEHDACTEEIDYNDSDPYTVTNGTGTRVLCGITIGGTNDITFEPGVYIIEGGDFDVTGNGSIYSDGATFILAKSAVGNTYAQLDITGGRELYFRAPEEGEDFEGIVFFQDRNAPFQANKPNRLMGNADLVLDGVAYFPNQPLVFGGDDTIQSPRCTRLIARTISLSGNPYMDSTCDGLGVRTIDPPSVRLIY